MQSTKPLKYLSSTSKKTLQMQDAKQRNEKAKQEKKERQQMAQSSKGKKAWTPKDKTKKQTAKQEQPKLSAGIETVASEQVLEVRKDEKVIEEVKQERACAGVEKAASDAPVLGKGQVAKASVQKPEHEAPAHPSEAKPTEAASPKKVVPSPAKPPAAPKKAARARKAASDVAVRVQGQQGPDFSDTPFTALDAQSNLGFSRQSSFGGKSQRSAGTPRGPQSTCGSVLSAAHSIPSVPSTPIPCTTYHNPHNAPKLHRPDIGRYPMLPTEDYAPFYEGQIYSPAWGSCAPLVFDTPEGPMQYGHMSVHVWHPEGVPISFQGCDVSLYGYTTAEGWPCAPLGWSVDICDVAGQPITGLCADVILH